MEKLNFKVDFDSIGLRIDKYIVSNLQEKSRSYIKFLIDNGYVLVNNEKVKSHYLIKENDVISVELYEKEVLTELKPEDIPINIVYEDDYLIVIDKKSNMVVHPGVGNMTGTLVNALLFYCGNLPEVENGQMRPGIVHRLDKDTTGLIVVAKNKKAFKSLAKQFQKRAVKKGYLALVKGVVQLDNGIIEEPLARNIVDRKKMEIDYMRGRYAKTVYHVIRRFKKFTFLKLDIMTGRTHQIRVHMKSIGYPVLGDVTYGNVDKYPRQMLHAQMLGFCHPYTGKNVMFFSKMPIVMVDVIKNR